MGPAPVSILNVIIEFSVVKWCKSQVSFSMISMEGIFLCMHFSNLSKQADRYLKDRQSICVTVYNIQGLQNETTTPPPP